MINNMTRSVFYLSLVLCLVLGSCGDTNSVQVNVLIPSGEQAIKTDIQYNMQNNGHKGVYFVVQELPNPVLPPPYVPVQGGESLQYPNSATGLDPTKVKFTIKSGQLDQSKPYIIKMRAVNSNNQVTHEGTADCYIDFSRPNLNIINICFKAIDSMGNCDNLGFQDYSLCKD